MAAQEAITTRASFSSVPLPLRCGPTGAKSPESFQATYAALKAPLFHGGASIQDFFRSLFSDALPHLAHPEVVCCSLPEPPDYPKTIRPPWD